jgi:hypothetical protein
MTGTVTAGVGVAGGGRGVPGTKGVSGGLNTGERGMIRNRTMLVKPWESVTPTMLRVLATTQPKKRPTPKTNTTSSTEWYPRWSTAKRVAT